MRGRAGLEDSPDGLGGAHGDGALFDNDLGPFGVGGDVAGDGFDKTEIGGTVGTESVGLRRRVDANEDDVGSADRGGNIGGEGEIFSPRSPDQLVESRFIDGKLIRIPGGDAGAVDINDLDVNVGAFRSDHRHGGTADVAGSDAADVGHRKMGSSR